MTQSARNPRMPGMLFLIVARHLFGDDCVEALFQPALADFAEELKEAGAHRARRIVVHLRWSWALTKLLFMAPAFAATTPIHGRPLRPGRTGGWLVALLALTLAVGTGRFFGWFTAAAIIAGIALAIPMRRWHDRHPSTVAGTSRSSSWRTPEINLSAIPVGGDIAGLFFAVGSVAIVMLGLPGLRWFCTAAVAGSLLIACAVHRRAAHDGAQQHLSVTRA